MACIAPREATARVQHPTCTTLLSVSRKLKSPKTNAGRLASVQLETRAVMLQRETSLQGTASPHKSKNQNQNQPLRHIVYAAAAALCKLGWRLERGGGVLDDAALIGSPKSRRNYLLERLNVAVVVEDVYIDKVQLAAAMGNNIGVDTRHGYSCKRPPFSHTTNRPSKRKRTWTKPFLVQAFCSSRHGARR